MPYVVGKSRQEATAILRDAGFLVDATVVQSYLPAGTWSAQSPSSGAQTVSGVTVHLSISNGVANRVTLPSVKGLSVDSAQYALSSIHITANVVERPTDDWTLDGIVFGMNPDAGTTVLEGSSVTLIVWNGPPPPSAESVPRSGWRWRGRERATAAAATAVAGTARATSPCVRRSSSRPDAP